MGVTSIEMGVTSIEMGVTSIEMGVTSIEMGVTSIEMGVASIDMGVTSIEMVVTSIEMGVTSIEMGVTSIEMGVASIEMGVTSIEMGVTSIEMGMTSIEMGVTSIEMGVTSIEMGVTFVILQKQNTKDSLRLREGMVSPTDQTSSESTRTEASQHFLRQNRKEKEKFILLTDFIIEAQKKKRLSQATTSVDITRSSISSGHSETKSYLSDQSKDIASVHSVNK
ncbi:hypothetical protein Btru_013995 [Bulinus truncatus]|nr:hypothetical protein Btru_013995 [Bulinus truncatus]